MSLQHPYWHHRCASRSAGSGLTRREWLARSAGVLALSALADWPSLLRAEESAAPANLPHLAGNAPSLPVAIRRCVSYEPAVVQEQMDAALDGIGGIGRLVRDKTVTVKVNMTAPADPFAGLPACRTYHIHPHVVAALCAALDRAGARRIAIVEAWYHHEPVQTVLTRAGWDVPSIQTAGGHKVVFENTRNRGTWGSYSRVKVPWGGYLFPAFELNGWYEHTDVFISLGKMKDHAVGGVTMTTKNLFGITPTALYGDDAPNEDSVQARVEPLHMNKRALPAGVPAQLGANPPNQAEVRVPRIVADLLGARPVDLAIIDGVESVAGGEGPWIHELRPVQPRLLFAGRNAICTDSVCAAAMGYDARASAGHFPFPGENHLHWASEAGLGSNDIRHIEMVGLALSEARCKFRTPA